jgi:hypothetical protein
VTNACLTDLLAVRVMGWTVGPDRFMMGNRGWMPRWRFQPTENLEDALRLLQAATAQEFCIRGDGSGGLRVSVRVEATTGIATGGTMAMAIATAVARAFGLEVPDVLTADGVNSDSTPRRRHRGK